jgi:hypothetical protein
LKYKEYSFETKEKKDMVTSPCVSVRLDGESVFIAGEFVQGKKYLGIEVNLVKQTTVIKEMKQEECSLFKDLKK